MKGKITKITPPYQSYNNDTNYWVTAFRMEDGSSARTFTCQKYKNFKKWKKMKVGDLLDGLVWKDGFSKLLDADYGRLYQDPLPMAKNLSLSEKEEVSHCLGL